MVDETVELLRQAGHEMIRFQVPDPQHMASLVFKNIMNDGGEYMRSLYANDIVDPYMKQFVMLLKVPSHVGIAREIRFACRCRVG